MPGNALMRPLVVAVDDMVTGDSYTYSFRTSPVLVGSGPEAALRIARPWVAGRQGEFEFDEARVWYRVLDPTRSTVLDGRSAAPGARVALGAASDVWIEGRLRMRVSRASPALAQAAPDRPQDRGDRRDPFGAASAEDTIVEPAAPPTATTLRERPAAPPDPAGESAHERAPADGPRHAQARGPATGPLSRGDRLGRYEIRQHLGTGGMGAVYRAYDPRTKRYVAVKTIPSSPWRAPEALQRFEREAQAIAQIDHPNIVKVHDYGVQGDRPYIVMDLLLGEDLATLLRRQQLAVSRAVDVCLGVSAAVSACHKLGIVHRDIKPRNVFVHHTLAGEVTKVLDFGVSRLPQGSGLTGPSDVVGTAAYMSPEQASGGEVGHKSDQYAIGVVLYETLTRRRPFEGRSSDAVLKAIVEGGFPPPSAHRADLPRRLGEVVVRALSLRPCDRFESVHALGASLLAFASEPGKRQWTDYFSAPLRDVPGQLSAPNPEATTPEQSRAGPARSTKLLPGAVTPILPSTRTRAVPGALAAPAPADPLAPRPARPPPRSRRWAAVAVGAAALASGAFLLLRASRRPSSALGNAGQALAAAERAAPRAGAAQVETPRPQDPAGAPDGGQQEQNGRVNATATPHAVPEAPEQGRLPAQRKLDYTPNGVPILR